MMSMTNPMAIIMGGTKDRKWVLFSERVHWIDLYQSLNAIIPNFQSGWFILKLCMWSFDYDLRILVHRIL